MRFKTLTIFLALVLSAISFYTLFCTYQINQLKSTCRKESTGPGGLNLKQYNELFLQAIEKKNTSFLGMQLSYKHLKGYAIQLAPDMEGGKQITVIVPEKEVLLEITHPSSFDKMKGWIKQLEDKNKELFAGFKEHIHNELSSGKLNEETLKKKFKKAYLKDFPGGTLSSDLDGFLLYAKNQVIEHVRKKIAERMSNRHIPPNIEIAKTGKMLISVPLGAEWEGFIKSGRLDMYQGLNPDRYEDFFTQVKKILGEEKFAAYIDHPLHSGHWYAKPEEKEDLIRVLGTAYSKGKIKGFPNMRILLDKNPNKEGNYAIYLLSIQHKVAKAEVEKVMSSRDPSEMEGGVFELSFELTDESGARFKQLSSQTGPGGFIAIVLDDQVVMYAAQKQALGKNLVISIRARGAHPEPKEIAEKKEEYQMLHSVLSSGTLPVKVHVLKQGNKAAALAQEDQKQGMKAMGIALVLIMLFMLIYYASAGLIANLSLSFNLLFVLGSIVQLKQSISLPGLGGMVISLGMAIDNMILILERIRDEKRMHPHISNLKAIAIGFNRAWRTILDANITTLLTGIILWQFGGGVIRNFASTLIIGITFSLFTAVLLSRVLMLALAYLIGPQRISFAFSFTKNLFYGMRFNFLKARKIAYLFSILIFVAGGVLYKQHGIGWGTQFTGGRVHVFEFGNPAKINVGQMKDKLKEVLGNDCDVDITLYNNTTLQIKTNYKLDDTSDGHEKRTRNKITKAIGEATSCRFVLSEETDKADTNYFCELENDMVSPSIAKEMTHSALIAILFALIMMLLYIFLSFRNFNMALSAIFALIHDTAILFTALVFAHWFGLSYQIDEEFITVLLTVIGYSVNDTVVVFARYKEHREEVEKDGVWKVANRSINETLSRTFITSLTTLIPILTLYFIGGIGLQALSFSLLVGILAGTYSSIFVAMPLSYDLGRLTLWCRARYQKARKKKA